MKCTMLKHKIRMTDNSYLAMTCPQIWRQMREHSAPKFSTSPRSESTEEFFKNACARPSPRDVFSICVRCQYVLKAPQKV